MNHREPQTSRTDEFGGAQGGRAVWENELPWQLPPTDGTGEDNPLLAPAGEHAGSATPDMDTDATLLSPAVPGPASGAAPDAGLAAADRDTVRPVTGPASRSESTRPRRAGRPASRGHLAKPILAGAGVLSALLLLAPHLFAEDAPLRTVQAGAEDTDPETGTAPDSGHSATPRTSPSPKASGGTAHVKDTGSAGHDTLVEVAATVFTPSAKPTLPSEATPGRTRSAQPSTAPEPSAAPAQQWTTTVVNATRVLEPGQSLSTNRLFFAFQGDGNLVLYDTQGTPLWWSGTVGQGGVKAVFQADGNLAVYSQDGRTVWSSHTEGHDGSRLVLRADGNVVIEQGSTVLWSTGTAM
ncbi:hypothetical protein ACWCPT_28020 [Streptomyces sp. NPDC002308]